MNLLADLRIVIIRNIYRYPMLAFLLRVGLFCTLHKYTGFKELASLNSLQHGVQFWRLYVISYIPKYSINICMCCTCQQSCLI